MKSKSREIPKRLFFSNRYDICICLFLLIATATVYWQVWNFEFVSFDDPEYVTENQYVLEGLSLEGIRWAFTTTLAANWHPLTWLSHMLDCQLYGLNAGGHHFTNLLFHILNTLILFFLLRKITNKRWQSAFVAALFALHPLRVESVAWVSERKDVLSVFFWMLTLWSYSKYVERPHIRRYIPTLLFFTLGLLSKPMLVTLPFVLLLLDYWPFQRISFDVSDEKSRTKQKSTALYLVKEKIPFFILAAISSIVTSYAQKVGGAVGSLNVFTIDIRLANAVVSYVKYLVKMIYPVHLSVLYPHHGMVPGWQVFGACLLLAGISYIAFKYKENHPYLIVGWLWYLGTLVPVIGLVQVGSQALADRYTYIPHVGIFIIIAWGISGLVAKWRYKNIGFAAGAAVVLSFLAAATWVQLPYWTNTIRLFEQALAVTVNNSTAHYNLGIAYADQGKKEKAILHYTAALRIKPNFVKAHNNLGLILVEQDKISEAIDHYRQALRIDPDHVAAHNNLGSAYKKQGNMEEAIKHYREAVRINPEFEEAQTNLGIALAKQGSVDEAIRHFKKAIRENPELPEAYISLGNALAKKGDLKAAIGQYSAALRIKPDFPAAHNSLGNAKGKMGKVKEAIGHYMEALRIKPEFSEAHNSMANALAKQGKAEEAIKHYREAVRIKPDFAQAYSNLGNALMRQGNLSEAVNQFSEALRIKPDYANAHNNMGNALAKQGKLKQAVSHFSEALRIDPDFKGARKNLEIVSQLINKSAGSANMPKNP